MRKKLLSLALALCMLLGLLPTAVFAADIASGTCGWGGSWDKNHEDNITWRLTSDGTLVLEGTGELGRYEDGIGGYPDRVPWWEYVDQIKKVYVGKGITRLTYCAFDGLNGCEKATEMEFEDGNQLERISTMPPNLEKYTAPNGKNYFTYPGDIALYARNMDENGYITEDGNGKLELVDYPQAAALTSYTVKKGTEVIGSFGGNKNLKEIILPDGITDVGMAFFECSALEKLDLPESLTQLDPAAFWGCDALKTIYVPASVTNFEERATPRDGCRVDSSQSKAYVFSGDAPDMGDAGIMGDEKYIFLSVVCSNESEKNSIHTFIIKSNIYYPQNASGWEELAQEYTNELTEFIPYDPAVGPFPKPSVTPATVTIKDADPVYMVQGDTRVLTVETDPAGGEVYWLSSDTSVVTVDRATGKLTAVAPGSAMVTADAVLGGAGDNVTVWVTKPSSGGSSGGGGGSSSGGSSTETTRNPDGSVTKTVINKRTGTVTVTTTAKDGTKTVVETTKDGTVTKTVTDPKGGKVTTVTKNNNTATITLSGGKTQAVVELPVKAGVGTVAVIVHADGTEEILKTTVPAKEGVKLLVNKNVTVQFKDNAKTFTDIPANSWAKDAIDFVSARGIFKGTSETTFTPTQEIDRAMMATLLFRLADGKAEGKNTFADVPEDTWYTDSVLWANANGIVTGYDNGAFGPTDVVTREQMAVMFYRYAKLLDMDTTVKGGLDKFTDMAAASDWAVEAMTWCVGAGLMNGTSDTTLSPAGTASRAEVATMLMRMVELMVG